MRTQLTSVLLAVLAFGPAACRSVPARTDDYSRLCMREPAQVCSADGTVLVQAVDDRRILIALDRQDGQKPDGLVDQLFLYTASESHGYQPEGRSFSGHVEYGQGFLRVIGKAGQEPLLFVIRSAVGKDVTGVDMAVGRRFDHSIGLSHYTGLRPLPIERLKALRASAQCDGPAGSCVEVDGFRIGFPA
jgi:hypothetical protein